MQLILFKSLIAALAIVPASNAQEKKISYSILRSNLQKQDDPLSPQGLDVIIENIAKHIWDGKHPPKNFVVKGSYAASVWAARDGLDLPYNDIDVMVETAVPTEKCQNDLTSRSPSHFISSSHVHGLIPGRDKTVQVTVLCKMDPKEQITQLSDINSVSIGFTVVPELHHSNLSGDLTYVPVIKNWDFSTQFEDFIQAKKLKIVEENVAFTNSLGRSFIRLLRKGQELKIEYTLPKKETMDKLHGMVILPQHKAVLDSLEAKHKHVLYSRFDLVPVHNGKQYMYVQKGLETPVPPSTQSLKDSMYMYY